MAEFAMAVEKTLANEGGFVHFEKTGEVSNYGISCWFLRSIGALKGSGPASDVEIAYVRNLSRERAVELYYRYFWCANSLGEIRDQALANKIFDLCVNMGGHWGMRLLQEAANAIDESGGRLAVDGESGERTIATANSLNAESLLAQYRSRAASRYREIAASNPNEAGYLPGWLERLAA